MRGEEAETCEVIGGRAEIKDVDSFLSRLRSIARRHGVVIQVFDASKVAGAEHLRAAVEKALRARRRGRCIAKDFGVEILLYAAGRRHVSKALGMGVSENTKEVAVTLVGAPKNIELAMDEILGVLERDDAVLELSERKKESLMEFFGITDAELEAVGEEKLGLLVLERVAMLDVQK
ncbi:MAG: KEOPS complex subunit Cgi121 [Candidatus Alkanophagales archaeon]